VWLTLLWRLCRKRLIALAAQKFVSDIAQDAYQYCKLRQQGMTTKEKKSASKVSGALM
jgi:hypothetical protein